MRPTCNILSCGDVIWSPMFHTCPPNQRLSIITFHLVLLAANNKLNPNWSENSWMCINMLWLHIMVAELRWNICWALLGFLSALFMCFFPPLLFVSASLASVSSPGHYLLSSTSPPAHLQFIPLMKTCSINTRASLCLCLAAAVLTSRQRVSIVPSHCFLFNNGSLWGEMLFRAAGEFLAS